MTTRRPKPRNSTDRSIVPVFKVRDHFWKWIDNTDLLHYLWNGLENEISYGSVKSSILFGSRSALLTGRTQSHRMKTRNQMKLQPHTDDKFIEILGYETHSSIQHLSTPKDRRPFLSTTTGFMWTFISCLWNQRRTRLRNKIQHNNWLNTYILHALIRIPLCSWHRRTYQNNRDSWSILEQFVKTGHQLHDWRFHSASIGKDSSIPFLPFDKWYVLNEAAV